jgi:putative transposase
VIGRIGAEAMPLQLACRVLGASQSGFYAWRGRPPSARAIRHAWLTGIISEIHAGSRATYGARRVHAELTLGRGIAVGHSQVELLMRRAGLQGLPARRRSRKPLGAPLVADLVDRDFGVTEPDALWITDITEHPTREGKVYCCVVLDAFSRRVVGWSIDTTQAAALVTNALGMALENRSPEPGTILHSDHGTQPGFKGSSQHRLVEVRVGDR